MAIIMSIADDTMASKALRAGSFQGQVISCLVVFVVTVFFLGGRGGGGGVRV